MSVLFTDIRGFTSIAEALDPKSLSQLMNDVLTPLTEVIYKHHGTIDKYMGDCIMAFWGAPVDDPAHARNAVLAALEMQCKIKDMQPEFRIRNWPEVRIGIGLNSGRMSVGNMGSRVRLAYTVMGDAVNLASRLEGITKEYGADILVGEDTAISVPEFLFKEIDRVRVKGREKVLTIFEPLGLAKDVSPEVLEEARRFCEAVELYRKQQWSAAEEQLMELKRSAPVSRLYDVFLDRIAFLRLHSPGGTWDGSFTFNTK
jgi:adenylate cyclase